MVGGEKAELVFLFMQLFKVHERNFIGGVPGVERIAAGEKSHQDRLRLRLCPSHPSVGATISIMTSARDSFMLWTRFGDWKGYHSIHLLHLLWLLLHLRLLARRSLKDSTDTLVAYSLLRHI